VCAHVYVYVCINTYLYAVFMGIRKCKQKFLLTHTSTHPQTFVCVDVWCSVVQCGAVCCRGRGVAGVSCHVKAVMSKP